MYEYEIYNANTNEHDFIYGYCIADAWKRNKSLNPNDWKIVYTEYID